MWSRRMPATLRAIPRSVWELYAPHFRQLSGGQHQRPQGETPVETLHATSARNICAACPPPPTATLKSPYRNALPAAVLQNAHGYSFGECHCLGGSAGVSPACIFSRRPVPDIVQTALDASVSSPAGLPPPLFGLKLSYVNTVAGGICDRLDGLYSAATREGQRGW